MIDCGGILKDNQNQYITGNDGYPLRNAGEIPGEPSVLEKPLHNQHQQNEQGRFLGADIKERHRKQTGITDPQNNRPSLADVFRPEYDPSDRDQEKSQQHLPRLFY